MTTPLLTTKLYVPPSRPDLVSRPGLIERLNAGLHRQLTLVSAPAGFGKTTLLSAWVQQAKTNRQVAWLSLDERDDDLKRFLNYFVAALQTDDSAIGQSLVPILQAQPPPPTDAILTSLINSIAVSPSPITFILDDYHLIEAQTIHEMLSFLLENQPPQLHLVIATREDPDLPLARLRARGQVTELRGADLRFTPSEAGEFLNQVMGLNLSTADITALEARTEGWVAGLQLAALSMQGRGDAANFIQAFTGSHRFILDYLIEEVLECQSEQVRTFLLQTSVLERLRGPLCEAVTGQEDGQGMLEVLERANLFVVPLDDLRQWYRYHHLFADVLQSRLRGQQPDQVSTLHRRASEWYDQHDMPSAAIHHALASKDYERAADLAELAWPTWSGSYQSIAWLSWVEGLPEEQVRARPVLSVSFAWAYLNAGKLEAAEAKIMDAERWLEMSIAERDRPPDPTTKMVVVDEEQFRALPITLASAQAYHAQAIGNLSNTVKYTQRILDLLPDEDHPERGTATALQGLAYWASGDLESAQQTFSVGLALMEPQELIIGTFVLAEIKNTLGQLRGAIQTCERALQLADDHSEPFPIGTEDVYTGRSLLHLERGDLEAAAEDLATSKRLGEQVELPDWQYRWCIAQARLLESLEDLGGALDMLNKAGRLYVRTPLPKVRPIAALKARLWIKQGRLVEALSWVRNRGLSADDDLGYLDEFEHITLGRLRIAQYERDQVDSSIHEAMQLLERLLKAAEKGGRTRSVIEILVLQALADESRGDIPRALGALERALTLAEPEGYIQVFVDEGPSMGHLLYEALTRGIAPNYIQRLFTAFPATEPKHAASSPTQASQSELIEPLSEREIEVLQLLAEGLTNQEIGAQLYLSPNTVKVHAHNIYGKLGVNNRAQAGARARALGILSST